MRTGPKERRTSGNGGDCSGGHFFDSGSSRSVLIGHTTLVIVTIFRDDRSLGRVTKSAISLDFSRTHRRVSFVTVICVLVKLVDC